MIDFWQACLFAILQGSSEFLPVSSSGHLLLVGHLFGLRELPRLFTVVLHLASMAAVVYYLRWKLFQLCHAFLTPLTTGAARAEQRNQKRLCYYIIVASLPTAIIGLLVNFLDIDFGLGWLAACFLVTALLLWSQKKAALQSQAHLTLKIVLLIGVVQGLAVLPGISRSGATISLALLLGCQRQKAVEFSLLIMLPAVFGALLLELGDWGQLLTFISPLLLIISFLITFFVALLAIRLLIQLTQDNKMHYFALYVSCLSLLSFFLWLA